MVNALLIFVYFVYDFKAVSMFFLILSMLNFAILSLQIYIKVGKNLSHYIQYIFSAIALVCIFLMEFGCHYRAVELLIACYWTIEGIGATKVFGSIRVMLEVIQCTLCDIIPFISILIMIVFGFSLLNFLTYDSKNQNSNFFLI